MGVCELSLDIWRGVDGARSAATRVDVGFLAKLADPGDYLHNSKQCFWRIRGVLVSLLLFDFLRTFSPRSL